MNDTIIRKGTIMKRTTALALFGLACLMAMPSIAHARYRDGMNLYQYVRGNPVNLIDWRGAQASRPSAPRDAQADAALGSCRATLGALKREFSSGRGAVSLFYRCAVKRGCLNPRNIDCKYEPTKRAGGWYDPSDHGIYINARYFTSEATRKSINWWRVKVHELVHAVDCNTTFAPNKCLDMMIREARAYWRMQDKCTCAKACEDAWRSAAYHCYIAEAWEPAVKEFEEKHSKWWRENYGKPEASRAPKPSIQAPDQLTWYRRNRDRWVAACKAKCNAGPLKDNRVVDRECEQVLRK